MARGDRSARSEVRGPGELGDLGRAFDTMVAEVSRAEQARRTLTADVAHELRTPLAMLRAGLEELRDGFADPDPARLTSLHDQTLRLGRVVEDLAELAAAESAALSLRLADVDLAALARAELDAHAPRLAAAGLVARAELTEGVVVRADADRLHQALGNLLDNAERYLRAGDGVTVRVSTTGDEAVVQVADTGPGIPDEAFPHVFDRLWRGRGHRDVAGSGIGLAVVRELVTAHGGTVEATSGPAGGATFTIRLPTR
jgi:two-component system sensor histidine kinase BaeS